MSKTELNCSLSKREVSFFVVCFQGPRLAKTKVETFFIEASNLIHSPRRNCTESAKARRKDDPAEDPTEEIQSKRRAV